MGREPGESCRFLWATPGILPREFGHYRDEQQEILGRLPGHAPSWPLSYLSAFSDAILKERKYIRERSRRAWGMISLHADWYQICRNKRTSRECMKNLCTSTGCCPCGEAKCCRCNEHLIAPDRNRGGSHDTPAAPARLVYIRPTSDPAHLILRASCQRHSPVSGLPGI
jgi:hypothetical protein